jgi:hypothetical protein
MTATYDPLFIARFENGHETCTAVFCSPDSLGWRRGVELAHKAYRSLLTSALRSIEDKQAKGEISNDAVETARRLRELLKRTPKVVSGRFELNGVVIAERGLEAIGISTE